MNEDKPIYEPDSDNEKPDPDETPIKNRKVVTQPYDLAISGLVDQIEAKTIFLRPLSSRPRFQRMYVWTNSLASRLVESILLKVPIPPCYLSQNDEYELDVIDGQQRLYSLFRFVKNQFNLTNLEVLSELNGQRFFELPANLQRQLLTHTLRCVLITNESHPEIKFDVFERLNTSTVPLNAQEIRNCVYRGPLNELIADLSYKKKWLEIRGRKLPDKRLRDEEMILRFFAFELLGLNSYKTPLKHWLNDAAKLGRSVTGEKSAELEGRFLSALDVCCVWFSPRECFRRPGSKAINRALFDLLMATASKLNVDEAKASKEIFLNLYNKLLSSEDFEDLISRSVDHKSRTLSRFSMWDDYIEKNIVKI